MTNPRKTQTGNVHAVCSMKVTEIFCRHYVVIPDFNYNICGIFSLQQMLLIYICDGHEATHTHTHRKHQSAKICGSLRGQQAPVCFSVLSVRNLLWRARCDANREDSEEEVR